VRIIFNGVLYSKFYGTYIILLLQSSPRTKTEYDTEWGRGGGVVGKG